MTTTQRHPIDVQATRSRIAAFVLIVGLGVLALTAQLHSQSVQGSSIESVVEWGD